jgi:hypothetical protein
MGVCWGGKLFGKMSELGFGLLVLLEVIARGDDGANGGRSGLGVRAFWKRRTSRQMGSKAEDMTKFVLRVPG